MEKEHQIFGIRAIIEAIHAGKEIDKVFIQKDAQGDLMKDLMKAMKQKSINFSYVPVEKLNRLTPNNHQGAVATIAPIAFYTLEKMVEEVLESGKTPLFLILDQLSDARLGCIRIEYKQNRRGKREKAKTCCDRRSSSLRQA